MTSLPPATTSRFPSELPADRHERWAVLEGFLAAWFPETSTAGVDATEMVQAELRLGLRLPLALREFYGQFGARSDVWSLQDEFLRPGGLRVDEGFLTFCIENQGVVRWGIRVGDLPGEDPPVFVSDPGGGRDWLLESASTSAFALQFAVMNAKWSAAVSHRADGESSSRVVEAIERAYPRLPFTLMCWPASPTCIFGNDEVIIESHAATWLWVAARNGHALEGVLTLVAAAGMVWEDLKLK